MKKIVSILIVILILCAFCTPAFAEEGASPLVGIGGGGSVKAVGDEEGAGTGMGRKDGDGAGPLAADYPISFAALNMKAMRKKPKRTERPPAKIDIAPCPTAPPK